MNKVGVYMSNGEEINDYLNNMLWGGDNTDLYE